MATMTAPTMTACATTDRKNVHPEATANEITAAEAAATTPTTAAAAPTKNTATTGEAATAATTTKDTNLWLVGEAEQIGLGIDTASC